ncbi:MmgE/PrpD family protein [Actinomadura sp. LOL_016]|uniref:MmgE/PrpD family protein n=1 Tax=unclassified Actinomadura TaxID=2626254 RepID=UPI003A7F91F2
MTTKTVAQDLAALAPAMRATPLATGTAEAAERVLLDWLGVTLGGGRAAPAQALIQGFGRLVGPSRVVGGGTAPPPIAALINGTAAHTLELDDIYAPGLYHPGAPTIAAGLAVADQTGASGERLLRAIVTGYEVGCRVAADLGPEHYRNWHTTGTAGSVGAAAAAAEILGLEEPAFAHALALSATMASGLQQTFRGDAMGKPLHAGNAAQAGVVAAALARGGVTGAPDVLEGAAGLAAATGAATSDWAHCRATLDRGLAVESITVKPYPCCGHTFAVIDAVLLLRERGLAAEQVDRLEVGTYAAALDVAGIARPATVPERRFSIPHLAAVALTDGAVTEASVERDRTDERFSALVGAVALEVEQPFEERFPGRRGARVTAVTRDGRRLTAEVPDRSGSPQNPLPRDRMEQKFLAAATAVLGPDGRDLLERVRGLRDGDPVSGLILGSPVPDTA